MAGPEPEPCGIEGLMTGPQPRWQTCTPSEQFQPATEPLRKGKRPSPLRSKCWRDFASACWFRSCSASGLNMLKFFLDLEHVARNSSMALCIARLSWKLIALSSSCPAYPLEPKLWQFLWFSKTWESLMISKFPSPLIILQSFPQISFEILET